jgi:hypothetical protein
VGRATGGAPTAPRLLSRLPGERAALERAKARLDRLSFYPEPVRIDRVRIRVAPAFFRLPGYANFHGFTLVRTILVRKPDVSDNLITHELCHVWQMQHAPVRATIGWFRYPYRQNPFEIEARRAVDETRPE